MTIQTQNGLGAALGSITLAPSTFITLSSPAVGRSPTGFTRIHVEMPPHSVGRLVGYDPRTLQAGQRSKSKRGVPHNISAHIVELQARIQRSIDPKRVGAMVEYLRAALTTGSFADWGAIELVTSASPHFTPATGDRHAHDLAFDTEAEYFVTDGQHRYCALLDFVQQFPELAREFTQGVNFSIMPAERLEEWAGQSFHDRNYYATPVRVGRALSVDSRNPVNALAKQLDLHPTIQRSGGIAYERDTLLAGDVRLTTHSVIHRFVRGFLFGRPGLDGKSVNDSVVDVSDGLEQRISQYLLALGEVLPWFGEDREQFLTRASVVFAALGVIGHDLFNSGLEDGDIGMRISRLARLDWRRTNLMWVGILGSEKDGKVQPASCRPAIDGLIRFLRRELGLLPGE